MHVFDSHDKIMCNIPAAIEIIDTLPAWYASVVSFEVCDPVTILGKNSIASIYKNYICLKL